jgi:isopentenyl-diphosphate delta-isomerase
MSDQINPRKIEHINIVKEKDVEPVKDVFKKYSLPYCSLPELDLKKIDTSTNFLNHKISMPLMISSMTGGPELAGDINKNLAIACQETGIPLALGSMRVIFKYPETLKSFQVKELAKDIPVIGNIGLVQLNYGIGLDQINKLIEDTKIDALFFHINHLQEAIQPEGDVNFSGLFEKLEQIISKIQIPVMVKEVGAGIDFNTAKKLYEIGVKYIDVAGLGGTSWTSVEAYRRQDDLGFVFQDVGIPTDKAIIECSKIDGLKIIAGGGVRNGLDIVKSLMLGASIAGMAKPLLGPALEGSESCVNYIEQVQKQIQIAMFAMGSKNIEDIKTKSLIQIL